MDNELKVVALGGVRDVRARIFEARRPVLFRALGGADSVGTKMMDLAELGAYAEIMGLTLQRVAGEKTLFVHRGGALVALDAAVSSPVAPSSQGQAADRGGAASVEFQGEVGVQSQGGGLAGDRSPGNIATAPGLVPTAPLSVAAGKKAANAGGLANDRGLKGSPGNESGASDSVSQLPAPARNAASSRTEEAMAAWEDSVFS